MGARRSWSHLVSERALAACAALIVAAACTGAYQSQQEWFVSGADEQYPPDRYVVGVGYGDSMKDADDMAIGEVAKFFNTKVVTVTRTEEQYTGNNDGERGSSRWDFESRTFSRVRGEADLEGVEVVRRTEENGLHYSMAVLDRPKAACALRRSYTFLDLKIQEALSAPASDASARIRGLARGLYLMEERARLGARLRLLGYEAALEPQKYRELAAELTELLRSQQPIVIRSDWPEMAALLTEDLDRRGLVVTSEAASGVVVDASHTLSSQHTADAYDLSYSVTLSATRSGETLAEKHLAERLTHPNLDAGSKKVLYEIRDDALVPFCDELERSILGDYSREESEAR